MADSGIGPADRTSIYFHPLIQLFVIKQSAFIVRYIQRAAAAGGIFRTKSLITDITAADLGKNLLKFSVKVNNSVILVNNIDTGFRSKIFWIHIPVPVRQLHYNFHYYYSIF